MRLPLARSMRMERRGPAMALGSFTNGHGSHAQACEIFK
jgi:hypothetical protein